MDKSNQRFFSYEKLRYFLPMLNNNPFFLKKTLMRKYSITRSNVREKRGILHVWHDLKESFVKNLQSVILHQEFTVS